MHGSDSRKLAAALLGAGLMLSGCLFAPVDECFPLEACDGPPAGPQEPRGPARDAAAVAPDAGVTDAGARDGGPMDGGAGAVDAGAAGLDAGGCSGPPGSSDGGLLPVQIFQGACPALLPPPSSAWCRETPGAEARCRDAVYLAPGRIGSLSASGNHVAFTTLNPAGVRAEGGVWLEDQSTRALHCLGTFSYPPQPAGNVLIAGGFVYWTDFTLSAQRGHIRRVPVTATWQTPAEDFVTEGAYAFRLRATATHLYWAPLDTGELRRRAHGGGATEVLVATPHYLSHFDVDATHLYWVTGFDVRRKPLAGGPVEILFSMSGLVHFQKTRDRLVFRNAAMIGAWSPTAGGPTVLHATTDPLPSFAADDERVFYHWVSADSRVHAAALDGSGAGVWLEPLQQGRLAVDGCWLYVGGDSLWKVPK